MINRPPTPEEVIELVDVMGVETIYWDHSYNDVLCMQEALTVEWMIEQGLMPDTSQFKFINVPAGEFVFSWSKKIDGWSCEDTTL